MLVLLVFPLVFVLRVYREEAAMRRGVRAEAVVVGTDRAPDGDTDFLIVRIGGRCACTVEVATDNPGRHPVESTIPVRYDPLHPQRAVALVDRPNPYGPVLPMVAGLSLVLAIVAPIMWAAGRRRRRSLALLATTTPTMRVRVEAWQLARHNATLYFLSVYPASSPQGAEPLLCMPADSKTLARLRPGQTFGLYGEAVPGGPLALRAGDLVITAHGRTRPSSWEAKHRAPLTDIDLISPAGADGPALDVPAGRLFADAAEALAWRRNLALVRWLVPVLILLPAIRIMPPRLILWALPVLGIVLVAEYGALWRRRRLLDRAARRLPGPRPSGRLARRAARGAASAHLSSPAGLAEMAELLDTTPERLNAQRRLGAALMYVALGVLALLLVAVLVVPGAVARSFRPLLRRSPPAIAGAPGYRTFTGPLGRPLAVGRPWGRPCQPIRFTVEEHVPDDVYDQVAAVVTAARGDGLNVTMESRTFTWAPASLYYPPGTGPDDVRRVPVFSDNSTRRKMAGGQPERVLLGWDAEPDADGRHENLTYAQGKLQLAILAGDPPRQRRAIRQLVALTQGVGASNLPDSPLRSATANVDFSVRDLDAMRLMSGCGHSADPNPAG